MQYRVVGLLGGPLIVIVPHFCCDGNILRKNIFDGECALRTEKKTAKAAFFGEMIEMEMKSCLAGQGGWETCACLAMESSAVE